MRVGMRVCFGIFVGVVPPRGNVVSVIVKALMKGSVMSVIVGIFKVMWVGRVVMSGGIVFVTVIIVNTNFHATIMIVIALVPLLNLPPIPLFPILIPPECSPILSPS